MELARNGYQNQAAGARKGNMGLAFIDGRLSADLILGYAKKGRSRCQKRQLVGH